MMQGIAMARGAVGGGVVIGGGDGGGGVWTHKACELTTVTLAHATPTH